VFASYLTLHCEVPFRVNFAIALRKLVPKLSKKRGLAETEEKKAVESSKRNADYLDQFKFADLKSPIKKKLQAYFKPVLPTKLK
jgi:hypothetical protein